MDYLSKLRSLIGSALQPIENTVSGWGQNLANTVEAPFQAPPQVSQPLIGLDSSVEQAPVDIQPPVLNPIQSPVTPPVNFGQWGQNLLGNTRNFLQQLPQEVGSYFNPVGQSGLGNDIQSAVNEASKVPLLQMVPGGQGLGALLQREQLPQPTLKNVSDFFSPQPDPYIPPMLGGGLDGMADTALTHLAEFAQPQLMAKGAQVAEAVKQPLLDTVEGIPGGFQAGFARIPGEQIANGLSKANIPSIDSFLSRMSQQTFGADPGTKAPLITDPNLDPSIQKAMQYMHSVTNSHDPEQSVGALTFLKNKLGNEFDALVQHAIDTNMPVKDFWQVGLDTAGSKTPDWKILDQEWQNALAHSEPPAGVPASGIDIPQGIPPTPPQEPPQFPPTNSFSSSQQPEHDPLSTIREQLATLQDNLMPKELATPGEEVQNHFAYGTDTLKNIYNQIAQEVQKTGTPLDQFVHMVEGKQPVPPELQPLVDLHHQLTDTTHALTENDTIGKLPNYFPHSQGSGQSTMDQLFPGTWISTANKEGGNLFNSRTGSLTNYSTDYPAVMGNHAEQVMYEKYRGALQGITPTQQTIVDHMSNLEETKPMDYVAELNKVAEEKGQEVKNLTYSIKARVPLLDQPIRTTDDLFEKMGKEAPDLTESYKRIRDMKGMLTQNIQQLQQLAATGDAGAVVKRVAELVQPQDTQSFYQNSATAIKQYGLDGYISRVMNYSTYQAPLQQFIDTLAQYNVTDATTRKFLNEFVDGQAKESFAHNKLLDSVTSLFSMAQIGGNLKIPLNHLMETFRLPANYTMEESLAGLKKSFSDPGIIDRYGLGETHYSPDGLLAKTGLSVKNALYKPLNAALQWKNSVFAGAAEAKGMAQGLTGDALTRFVRDEMFKNSYMSNEFNSVVAMQKSPLMRALFQYSQYATKNMMAMYDAGAEKQYGKLAKLVTANLAAGAIINELTGEPLQNMTSHLLPFVSSTNNTFKNIPIAFGPVISLPMQAWDQLDQHASDQAQGLPTRSLEQRALELGIRNVVPGGTQAMKTLGAFTDLKKGYDESGHGNVNYLAPEDKLTQGLGLLFGKGAFSTARQYNNSANPATNTVGGVQGGYIKQLFDQGNPDQAKQAYQDAMQGKADQKTLQILQKKEDNGTSSGLPDGYWKNPETGKVEQITDYTKAKLAHDSAEADYALQADRLKRANDYEGWSKLTEQHIADLQKYQQTLDPTMQKPEVTKLENTIEDLQNQLKTYDSYGGFKKGLSQATKARKVLSIVGNSRSSRVKTVTPLSKGIFNNKKFTTISKVRIPMIKARTGSLSFATPKRKSLHL